MIIRKHAQSQNYPHTLFYKRIILYYEKYIIIIYIFI